jgi:hypothetical protein
MGDEPKNFRGSDNQYQVIFVGEVQVPDDCDHHMMSSVVARCAGV